MDIPSGCCWEDYHCSSGQKCKRNSDPEVAGVCEQAATPIPSTTISPGERTPCWEDYHCSSGQKCKRNSDPEVAGVCEQAATPIPSTTISPGEECAKYGG